MNLNSKNMDQAETLRRLAGGMAEGARRQRRPAFSGVDQARVRVISVTSGKGGVGKSNVVVNLGIALSRMGLRVLIIDADLGLANIDILLGITPNYNMNHVLAGEKGLADIITTGPGGVRLLPAGSGEQKYTSLGPAERLRLLDELDRLEEEFDLLIIDTDAGISENVTYFNMAAQDIIVVATPEPASINDCGALVKLMATRHAERHFKVLVNMAHDDRDAREVFSRLMTLTSAVAEVQLEYLGYVLRDDRLPEAVKRQCAVSELFPESVSSLCFDSIARKIAESTAETRPKGNVQFLLRRFFPSSLVLEPL